MHGLLAFFTLMFLASSAGWLIASRWPASRFSRVWLGRVGQQGATPANQAAVYRFARWMGVFYAAASIMPISLLMGSLLPSLEVLQNSGLVLGLVLVLFCLWPAIRAAEQAN